MRSVWAFDLDGTLIGSVRSNVLRPHASALLHRLSCDGVSLVLWSAGGREYAARHAAAQGISHHFTAFYDKGMRDQTRRYTTAHFSREHRPHVFVDDAPDDLPLGADVIAVPQFIGGNSSDSALLMLLARWGERRS
jgi:phosphoglycolate phosphatase-like HAD superfamily hydrolase